MRLKPQGGDDLIGAPDVRRLSIDKDFHGDLETVSKRQMLAAATSVEYSAGYVAIEQVSGTQHGRQGPSSSGTGEFTALSGQMNIIIADGEHRYEFEYSL